MILIQAILIAAFVVLVLRFLANPDSHRMKAWQKIFGLLFFMLAVVAVLLPNSLNSLAHVVGVGRGADLLLYVLTLAFLFVVCTAYVKERQNQQRMVGLTRRTAIIEANALAHNVELGAPASKPAHRKKV